MHAKDRPERTAPPGRPRRAAEPISNAMSAESATSYREHPEHPERLSPELLPALQRSVGNAAVGRLLADQRSPVVVQRAPTALSPAQRSLRDLAGRWKVQTFFALTTGRSNELQRVDAAVANWRRALEADPASPHQDLLNAIQQAITDWRAVKGTGSRSFRAAHIDSLSQRVTRAITDAGATAAPAAAHDEDEELDSEDEYFSEKSSEHASAEHSSESESESSESPWVFSTNGGMAVGRRSGSKDFFALPDVIDRANEALGDRGSPLQLRLSSGEVPEELAQRGLRRVEPVMVVHGEERTGDDLLDVNECIEVARKVTGDRAGNVLLAPEEEGGERVSHRQEPNNTTDFSAYARLVTRPGMTPERLARNLRKDTEYFRFTWREAEIDVDVEEAHDGDVDEAITAVRAQLVTAGMDTKVAGTLLREMERKNLEFHPGLQQILVDRAESAALLDGPLSAEKTEGIRDLTGKVGNLIKSRYRPYEAPNPERDRRLGINESATAEVGEAFGIYGTRARKREEKDEDRAAGRKAPWTYHFAGVVAKDGEDVVTLENYNRRDKPGGNAMWYFALYGGGRTFHGTHKETVTDAITLAMG
ncbi:hypothetical protein F0L68_11680 [Solihabitans fulvus]|uniref:Uncharacterized protein n=1 Tax=Solihabitans fulvus TaxID=1892852 RepID=A0A5B2XIK0_9PSEU|nr:hypothetical protein [Solihabitans fulvus]KAA2262562.1 hypothetical protein F0L68_11680 [Solihabitans fulvus]